MRCTINYHQDNWIDLLPLAEFAHNNTCHSSTRHTPFFTNYGRHPKFDTFHFTREKNLVAEDLAHHLADLREELTTRLQEAQVRHKNNVDHYRIQHPPYKVGDQVWLLRRNLRSTRPSRKLDYHRFGPFPIVRQINPISFQLQLPRYMKIHPVFHVSLLKPFYASTLPVRLPKPPPPVEIDGIEEFEVDEILDSRILRGRLEYLVHWQGYDINERTLEPAPNLIHASTKVCEFHQRYPTKPKVWSS